VFVPQAADVLAVNAREKADPAVGLAFRVECEFALGRLDVDALQEFGEVTVGDAVPEK